jgi:hypothetical protein
MDFLEVEGGDARLDAPFSHAELCGVGSAREA